METQKRERETRPEQCEPRGSSQENGQNSCRGKAMIMRSMKGKGRLVAALGNSILCLGVIVTLTVLSGVRADDKDAEANAPAKKLPSLEKALVDSCPAILDHLRKAEHSTVGVLKFQVQRGKGPLTDNAGPINRRMADRLETALILALKDDSIRILRGASDTVVRSRKRISHATEEGRKALLEITT